MPYQPHTLITCGGTLSEVSGQDEIWQVGIRGFNTGGGPVDPSQHGALALVVAVGPAGTTGLSQWFTNVKSHMANIAQLKWVKVVNIGPTGAYTSDPTIFQYPSPIVGVNPAALPSFCTLVLSFTTGKSFGKARSGRIYPPNYGCSLGGGAIITTSLQNDLRDSALQFLSSVDQAGDEFDFNPTVISSSGVSNPITGVRVGNVIDTQRRRKNAVGETYVSAPR